MKLSLLTLLVALVVACFSMVSPVEARGICYDPQHVSPITIETVRADLRQIKSLGFEIVRTYVGIWGDLNLGVMIINHNMDAAITIPFDNSNPNAAQVHTDAAVVAARHRTGGHQVRHIYVGNENLAMVNAVPAKMFDIIGYLKSILPGDVKIGTVQRNTEYLDPSRNNISGLKDLLAQCMIVGVNIHPVFTPGTNPEGAIGQVDGQWKQLMGDVGGKFPGLAGKMSITEVGWPSGGTMNGNTGTPEGTKRVFNDFKAWRARSGPIPLRSFFFQMYNMPYRTDGPFEPWFGIARADRSLKFPITW